MEATPTSDELKELFKTTQFRTKLIKYLKDVIRAHIGDMDKEIIKNIPHEADLAWSRPLNPTKTSFAVDRVSLEQRLMRSNQIHTCRMGACLSYHGRAALLKCKRRAPWPISNEVSVDERGNWTIQRSYGYVNNCYCLLFDAITT
jgi:hypothetical protein